MRGHLHVGGIRAQFYKELTAVLCAETHYAAMSEGERAGWEQPISSSIDDERLRYEI